MKLPVLGEGREIGHEVKLSKQMSDNLAAIVTLTQPFDLLHDAGQKILGLFDRVLGEILTLLFETPMVFRELFAKERRETLARRPG